MRPYTRRHWLSSAALLCISACGREATRGSAGAPPRVVSLHDVTTEIVVALGATERLTGLSRLVDPTESVRAAVAGLPEVGSLESIIALGPDLVLGLEVTRQEQPELVSRLEAEGVGVYLARPGSIDAVYAMTLAVGTRLGVAARAEEVIAELRRRIESATSRQSSVPKRVFVYDCCNPPFSAGGHGVMNQLITRAGGQNIFADLNDDWASVSWEEVLGRRPEFLVVHAYEHAGQADVAGKRAELARIPGLAGLPSVVLPLGCALGGLRSAEGLERLSRALKGVT